MSLEAIAKLLSIGWLLEGAQAHASQRAAGFRIGARTTVTVSQGMTTRRQEGQMVLASRELESVWVSLPLDKCRN